MMLDTSFSVMVVGSGRMGSQIVKTLKKASISIFQVVDTAHPPIITNQHQPSMILDFSHPDCLYWIAPYVKQYHIPLIGGTTGYHDFQKQTLHDLSKEAPIFYDTNYAIGIAILKKIVENYAPLLSQYFDMGISELHHLNKKDKPSGTALQLSQMLQQHTTKDISLHSLRGGNSPGTHTLYFLGNEEELIFQHISHHRSIFMHGILQAIHFLKQQSNGFYTMHDVLKDIE